MDHQLEARHEPTAMGLAERAFPLLELWSTSVCKPEPFSEHQFPHLGGKKWENWTRRPLRFLVLYFQVDRGRYGSLSQVYRSISSGTLPKVTPWGGRGGVKVSDTARWHPVSTRKSQIRRGAEVLGRVGSQRLRPIPDWPPNKGTPRFQSHIALACFLPPFTTGSQEGFI